MIRLRGQAWRRRAVCFLETSAAPELWTPDRAPARRVQVHLQQMCRRCPVRRECAAEAVALGAEAGMYAGVWVPEHRTGHGWAAAIEALRVIARADVGDVGRGAPGGSA